MRIFFHVTFLLASQLSIAQTRVFKEGAKALIEAKDSLFEIVEVLPSSEPFDFLSEGTDPLNELFLTNIKSVSRNRPDTLRESKTLSTLAELATLAWKGSQYSDSKKWAGIAQHFRRAFERSSAKFNYTKQISFRMKLLDNNGKPYYLDKKAGVSELDLYVGKKPTGLSKSEMEDLPDPIPLELMTENQLVEQFTTQIKRKKLMNDLKRGRYAFVGINVEIDQNTLHKNRIPTARVVLVLGARRLRDIRFKQRLYVREVKA
jgi:hypothetical protein